MNPVDKKEIIIFVIIFFMIWAIQWILKPTPKSHEEQDFDIAQSRVIYDVHKLEKDNQKFIESERTYSS